MEAAGPLTPEPGTVRRASLEVLLAATQAPVNGGGHLLVTGPVASGKTTLLRTLHLLLGRNGRQAWYAAATHPAFEPPLGLWFRLAGGMARQGVAIPAGLQGLPRSEDGGPNIEAVLGDLQALIEACGPAPSVLLLDQLDGADPASLHALVSLLPLVEEQPVTVVSAYRAVGAHPTSQARHALSQLQRDAACRIELAPLSEAEIVALTVAVAGTEARSWARRWHTSLRTLSAGRPGPLLGLLADLAIAEGARPPLDPPPADPQETRGTAHLDAADPGLRAALEFVAIAAGAADVDLARAVLDPTGLDDLDRALAAGLLTLDTGRLELALPGDAPALRRRAGLRAPALHHRIGRALLARAAPHRHPAAALSHLRAAGSLAEPDLLRTAAELCLADPAASGPDRLLAREVRWASTHRGSDAWCRRGLELVDDAVRLARYRRAWEVAAAVLAGADPRHPEHRVAAALALARGAEGQPSAASIAAKLAALAEELGTDHPDHVRLLARAATLAATPPRWRDDPATGSDPATRSDPAPADVPVAPGDRRTIGRALLARAEAARASGQDHPVAVAFCATHPELAHHAARLRLLRTLPGDADEPELWAAALGRLVVDALAVGERHQADAALERLAALGADTGNPMVRWRACRLATMLGFATGELDTARRQSHRARRIGDELAVVAARTQARIDEFQYRFETTGEASTTSAPRDRLVRAALRWARAAAATGSPAALGRAPDELPPLAGDPLARDLSRLRARAAAWTGDDLLHATLLADTAWLERRAALAGELLTLLRPWSDRIAVDDDGRYCHGAVARPLAGLAWLTGQHDRAAELAQQAAAREQAAGLDRWLLVGELDTLTRHDDPDDPTQRDATLVDLAARAEALGLHRLARLARSHRPMRSALSLTERQLAVLRGLSRNATYRQIAAELGYSHSVVRKEAIALYAALDVDGRQAAVTTARAAGLL